MSLSSEAAVDTIYKGAVKQSDEGCSDIATPAVAMKFVKVAIVHIIPGSSVHLQFHQVNLVVVAIIAGDGGDGGLDRLVVAILSDARCVPRADRRGVDSRRRIIETGSRPPEVIDLTGGEDFLTRRTGAERTVALLWNLDGAAKRDVLLVVGHGRETLGRAVFGVVAINGIHVPFVMFVIIRVPSPRSVCRESRSSHRLLASHDLGRRRRL